MMLRNREFHCIQEPQGGTARNEDADGEGSMNHVGSGSCRRILSASTENLELLCPMLKPLEAIFMRIN